MSPIDRIKTYADELTALRRDLHAHPELGFEEVRTSGIVADLLELVAGPVAHGGHCVARVPVDASGGAGEGATRVVFVRHALPGERVVLEVTEGGEGDPPARPAPASPARRRRPARAQRPGRAGGPAR